MRRSKPSNGAPPRTPPRKPLPPVRMAVDSQRIFIEVPLNTLHFVVAQMARQRLPTVLPLSSAQVFRPPNLRPLAVAACTFERRGDLVLGRVVVKRNLRARRDGRSGYQHPVDDRGVGPARMIQEPPKITITQVLLRQISRRGNVHIAPDLYGIPARRFRNLSIDQHDRFPRQYRTRRPDAVLPISVHEGDFALCRVRDWRSWAAGWIFRHLS